MQEVAEVSWISRSRRSSKATWVKDINKLDGLFKWARLTIARNREYYNRISEWDYYLKIKSHPLNNW